tara:strand:- start:1046 stop:1327 length:282 start_codon:yes stop_codon:yes gene_type:complete
MWTCIECEFKYSDDNGDSEERMCDSCLNKEETEKRERELMEEEKRYYADIKITWGVSFNARNKEEAIEWLKEQYKDDYGIDLNDDEIIKLEEE